ncbi:MAG: hypothetical protein FWE61_01050 [Micrococcales bacterium]|nr:hypothetical protein [Micrococcales bacterium]
MTPRPPAALVAVAAALAVLAAGCTNDPGTTPTAPVSQPNTIPADAFTPDPQDADDRAAIQTYTDFIAAYNQVGQDGYANYMQDLVWRFTYDEYGPKLSDELAPRAAAGAHQTGELILSNFKVVERKTTPPIIVLEVCKDTSNFDVVLPDGTSMLRPGTTGRYLSTVEMLHTRYDTWRVAMATTDRGRPC